MQNYALDLEKGRFSPHFPRPESPLNPKGKVVETGKRDNTRETI